MIWEYLVLLGLRFPWLHTVYDVLQTVPMIIAIPLFLSLVVYVLQKRKTVTPVIVYAVSNALLLGFRFVINAPKDCPLFTICTPYNALPGISTGYIIFWSGLIFLCAFALVLLYRLIRSIDDIREVLEKST